ncbi:phage integrase [Acidihalobacter yilgarnensis]|nr:hypothetical protein [Acidihalobacter yilgarnensis]
MTPDKRGAPWENLQLIANCQDDPLARIMLRNITPSDLAAWRDRRLKQVSPGTVLREWNFLSNAFSIGLREGAWAKENPLTRVRKLATPLARNNRLSTDGIERLIAIETVIQAGDLAGLTWPSIGKGACPSPYDQEWPLRDVSLSKRALGLIDQMWPSTG